MPDILIRNFEMPKDHSLWLVIRPDGMVFKIKDNDKSDAPKEGVAIFLPEGHGRCIDADAFLATIRPLCTEDAQAACTIETVKQLMVKHISSAPTIVPAEGGNTNG